MNEITEAVQRKALNKGNQKNMKKGEQCLEPLPAKCTELKPLLIGNDAMQAENGDLPSIPKENALYCLRKGRPQTEENGKIKSNENGVEANKGVLPNFECLVVNPQ
ncbi:unnamed protein product [Hymenolepis diminuta]|uniref:Uncharacterized protein n=1 Tax=Hymenolepis diminuta TaxID=6216 RepID=A0A564YDZ8_HYMDI|nr:unnamed protein product [Hymenolepis diminuta]